MTIAPRDITPYTVKPDGEGHWKVFDPAGQLLALVYNEELAYAMASYRKRYEEGKQT